MLLLILCTSLGITTTSCSKGPQGLHFPLGDDGMFTIKCVQKVLTWDSDYLVKPFMHVAIQTTRHYATLSTNKIICWTISSQITSNLCSAYSL